MVVEPAKPIDWTADLIRAFRIIGTREKGG